MTGAGITCFNEKSPQVHPEGFSYKIHVGFRLFSLSEIAS